MGSPRLCRTRGKAWKVKSRMLRGGLSAERPRPLLSVGMGRQAKCGGCQELVVVVAHRQGNSSYQPVRLTRTPTCSPHFSILRISLYPAWSKRRTRSSRSSLFLAPLHMRSSLLPIRRTTIRGTTPAGTGDCGADACAGAEYPSACCGEGVAGVEGWDEWLAELSFSSASQGSSHHQR